MEIHSSSLASIPSGYNARHKNDESRLIKIVEKNLQGQQNKSLILPPPVKIDETSQAYEFQDLTDKINQQQQPVNSRTSRALNSYIQENVKPLKKERSELISGIDYFI